ncbi:MAG: hypothetical protein IIA88_02590 [Bacteroidetes bacterium]|nr:hypothetical protein [Bacteroidota bacterium]
MKISFDQRGNLKPYNIIELDIEEFQKYFVQEFRNSITREIIFDDYLTYINDFKKDVTPNFIQWINGSFVTGKENPKDIDFLTIIDFQIYEAKAKLMDNQFRNPIAKAKYKLDAYTLKSYPLDHKNRFITEYDLLYWENWFGTTKMNRAKKKFSKGFIQIQF